MKKEIYTSPTIEERSLSLADSILQEIIETSGVTIDEGFGDAGSDW